MLNWELNWQLPPPKSETTEQRMDVEAHLDVIFTCCFQSVKGKENGILISESILG
jgi:hypothetical protein